MDQVTFRRYTCPTCEGHRVLVRRGLFGRPSWRWCPQCKSEGTVLSGLLPGVPSIQPMRSSYLDKNWLDPAGHESRLLHSMPSPPQPNVPLPDDYF